MGPASGGYPRHSRIHPIHLRLGGAVGWNIHHRIIDDMEAVDTGYGNSTEAAREHDVVCNGNVLPKTIEDRDTLRIGAGQNKIWSCLTLNVVAIDDKQIVYTIINSFDEAIKTANQIIKEHTNVECVIYDGNQRVLSFLRPMAIITPLG